MVSCFNKLTTHRRSRAIFCACVPLLGGPANRISSDYHVNTICYEAARKFAGQSLMIDFPAIVERPTMREAILQTDYYQDIEQMWQQISVAVFGMGSTEVAGTPHGVLFTERMPFSASSSKGVG
ncbi:MAG: sugar-binding domain-containing protein [Sporolactobacillus sp.]